ncbi:hypothetical protein OGATHE_005481 [Ogataea polymorpha]|uniref:Uncharacterized protein n=1 Tax=Ogataea polymorpha TaxID=460523 RepID=A0A9P8NVN1_9ASCO|nr:hypothetical protein OGATHE_005481 [Ogataea polymorpha]
MFCPIYQFFNQSSNEVVTKKRLHQLQHDGYLIGIALLRTRSTVSLDDKNEYELTYLSRKNSSRASKLSTSMSPISKFKLSSALINLRASLKSSCFNRISISRITDVTNRSKIVLSLMTIFLYLSSCLYICMNLPKPAKSMDWSNGLLISLNTASD